MTTDPFAYRFRSDLVAAELKRGSGTPSFQPQQRPDAPFASRSWVWNTHAVRSVSSRLFQQITLLERIIADAPVGMAVVQGRDFHYILVNPLYEACVAASHGPLLGCTVKAGFSDAIGANLCVLLRTVYHTGEPAGDTLPTLTSRTGDERTLRVDLVPLLEANDGVAAVLLLVYDATAPLSTETSSMTASAGHNDTFDYRVLLASVARFALPPLVDADAAETGDARLDNTMVRADSQHTFIHNLLHGLIDDEAQVLREARMLGMDLGAPRAVILIDAAAYVFETESYEHHDSADVQIRRRVQQVTSSIVSFFHLPNDTICAYLGDGEIAVLKASNTKNLATWANRSDMGDQSGSSWANLCALRRASEGLLEQLCRDFTAPVTIGIGRHHQGICGLARSYEDARAALSLGLHFHGPKRVHSLDRLGIASFVGVADERTKLELATYLLRPLDYEPELRTTLDVFFEHNCCSSTATVHLSIHRNTLSYRLDKVAALTGLDPRRFDDAVQLRLALALCSLHRAAAP